MAQLAEPLLERQGPGSEESQADQTRRWRRWRATALLFFFPALGGLLFGYDIGATSGAVLSIKDPHLAGVDWYLVSSIATGFLVSGSLIGALLGCVLAFVIADPLGRRKELLVAAALYLLSSACTFLAPSFLALVASRVVFGVGIGLSMHAAPIYIVETSPSEIRGTLLAMKEGMIVMGILLGFFASSLLIPLLAAWRLIYLCAAPLALLMLLGVLRLPSSPRWLMLRASRSATNLAAQLEAEARGSLHVLRGVRPGDAAAEGAVAREVAGIKAALQGGEGAGGSGSTGSAGGGEKGAGDWDAPRAEAGAAAGAEAGSCAEKGAGASLGGGSEGTTDITPPEGDEEQPAGVEGWADRDVRSGRRGGRPAAVAEGDSWAQLLAGPNLRALVIACGLVFFQQATGQPSVLYYAASILQAAGFPHAADATKVSVLIGLFKLGATAVAVLSVDRFGRRPLLLLGVSVMSVSLVLLALVYLSPSPLPVVSVTALLLYVGCYQMSFGPIVWLLSSEVFSLQLRGRAQSIAVLVNFAGNAAVAFAFAPLQASFGPAGTFLVFAAVAAAALAFIWRWVPETRGLTLEEVQQRLGAV